MSATWRRVGDGLYEHAPSGIRVERSGGRFSVWAVRGEPGKFFPALADVKRWVELWEGQS